MDAIAFFFLHLCCCCVFTSSRESFYFLSKPLFRLANMCCSLFLFSLHPKLLCAIVIVITVNIVLLYGYFGIVCVVVVISYHCVIVCLT